MNAESSLLPYFHLPASASHDEICVCLEREILCQSEVESAYLPDLVLFRRTAKKVRFVTDDQSVATSLQLVDKILRAASGLSARSKRLSRVRPTERRDSSPFVCQLKLQQEDERLAPNKRHSSLLRSR